MKTVRFQGPESLCTVVCEVTQRSEWSHEDHDRTWFAPHDYEAFKSHGKLVSKELRGSHRAKLLEGSLERVDPGKDGSIDIGGIDLEQMRLVQWSRQAASARGLERQANPALGCQRKEDRQQCIKAVLEVQDQMKTRPISPDLRVESLRAVSERCTAKARAFATKMGIADEMATFLELALISRSLPYLTNRNPHQIEHILKGLRVYHLVNSESSMDASIVGGQTQGRNKLFKGNPKAQSHLYESQGDASLI